MERPATRGADHVVYTAVGLFAAGAEAEAVVVTRNKIASAFIVAVDFRASHAKMLHALARKNS